MKAKDIKIYVRALEEYRFINSRLKLLSRGEIYSSASELQDTFAPKNSVRVNMIDADGGFQEISAVISDPSISATLHRIILDRYMADLQRLRSFLIEGGVELDTEEQNAN